jgi:hypothetical protein
MSSLPLLAVPAAAFVTVFRAAWSYLRRRDAKPRNADSLTSRANDWLKRATIHFLGRWLRRQWALYYALNGYSSSLAKRHRLLIIPGRVSLPIDRCYIPLELRAGQTLEPSQILSKSGAVLVLGDPGTGKSALMSNLTRTLAYNCVEQRDTAKLPVYVKLQQLTSYLPAKEKREIRPDEALEYLNSWFADYELKPIGLYDSSKMLLSLAQSPKNGVTLFLDGLDEVSAEHIERVENFIIAITEFMSVAPGGNVVVIASRRQALAFTPRIVDGTITNLTTVELQPFSPAAMYSFLLYWPYPLGYRGTTEAPRIFAALRRNPTLFETCSNPLALALYVDHYLRLRAIGQDYGGPEPDTRASFFSDVVDYLLIRRSEQLGLATPTRPVRQYRNSVFVAIAEEHVRSDQDFNHISHDLMLKHVTLLVREGQTAESALVEMAKDTGIIVRERDGSWQFIHRSFLDYFLANSIAIISRNQDLQNLFRQLKDHPQRYLDGFYFACGLMATRNIRFLETLLYKLGHNTFVGMYYPRAVLEAQAYFSVEFVERIRFYCDLWKRDRNDVDLFRDLAAVLIDYEESCDALGKVPEITALKEFEADFATQGTSVLQAARLSVDLAMRIAKSTSMAQILLDSPAEDAIVALYDPAVSDRLLESEIYRNGQLAALVAETALRSPLAAAALAQVKEEQRPDEHSYASREPFWGDTWPVRGTRYGHVLACAISYLQSLPRDRRRRDFPHLTLLSYTRPIKRLRYEVVVGDWRMTLLLASVFVLAMFPLWLVGWSPSALAIVSLPIAIVISLAFRFALLHGVVTPRSQRILNLRPLERESATLSDSHVKLINGDSNSLPSWVWRRPSAAEGDFVAVYVRAAPMLWHRFCPALGDARMPRAACAAVEHFYTLDVRRLLRR